MRRRNGVKGFAVVAFGAGLFLAYCFPTKAIIVALAVMLIAAGVFLLKA